MGWEICHDISWVLTVHVNRTGNSIMTDLLLDYGLLSLISCSPNDRYKCSFFYNISIIKCKINLQRSKLKWYSTKVNFLIFRVHIESDALCIVKKVSKNIFTTSWHIFLVLISWYISEFFDSSQNQMHGHQLVVCFLQTYNTRKPQMKRKLSYV